MPTTRSRPSSAASRRSRPTIGRASITRADRADWRPVSAARSMSRPSNCWRSNVAGGNKGGLANVSIEQVLAVESGCDRHHRPGFRRERAQRSGLGRGRKRCATGRVHLSPKMPFGWVDFPPSVNRLIGLWWLAKILYPDLFPGRPADADARFLRAVLSRDAERRADRARAGGAGLMLHHAAPLCPDWRSRSLC